MLVLTVLVSILCELPPARAVLQIVLHSILIISFVLCVFWFIDNLSSIRLEESKHNMQDTSRNQSEDDRSCAFRRYISWHMFTCLDG